MDTKSPLPWATPIRNSACRLSDYRRRWASAIWLDSRQLLMGGLHKGGDGSMVRWERLDTVTGARRPETAFGPRLENRENAGNDFHAFEPIAASPNRLWLLGYHDSGRRESTLGVLGPGGRKQTWPNAFKTGMACGPVFSWLSDSQRFVGFARHTLALFRVGQAEPERLWLRGLPRETDGSGASLLGTTARHTVILRHEVWGDERTEDLYEAPIENGGWARRLGRLPQPADNRASDVDINEMILSPRGDWIVRCARFDIHAKRDEDTRRAVGLWVCGIDGRGMRAIGRIPWHQIPSEPSDYGLLALNWHPDNRRVSFYFGDSDGFRLYTART